jgi:ketosteroid isomerase-like protein
MKPTPILAVLLSLATTGCQTPRSRTGAGPAPLAHASSVADQAAIAAVLDDWHAAAGAADGARYFGHMTADSVFLGTDATERWPLAAFRAFCEPYFAKGVGWTYVPKERHTVVEGDVAWFDEKLWNDKYGDCRGTGALRREGGTWKIAHYSLTLLVPNERAPDVIRAIRGQ